MNEVDFKTGIEKVLDALLADRLALLCGAGLSMAPPSSIPSAAELANCAKRKYDATYGADRPPLPSTIDEQTQFFFKRDELATIYLSTYVDHDTFAGQPNLGHFAVADLMLICGINTAVSTNVDTLIEFAGNKLFGQIGVGVDLVGVTNLPADKSPLLKIHGCWTNPAKTIWAAGQVNKEPTKTRIRECGQWLEMRLANHDLLVVGYWTDWDYLNEVLQASFETVNLSRVIVVDPCETETFVTKAPVLYRLSQCDDVEFCHVRSPGDTFLNSLRVEFSRSFIRRILYWGKEAYTELSGNKPREEWLEPATKDAEVLWWIRRDLEGCYPNKPSKKRNPSKEPLVGLTILQLKARGAVSNGSFWKLGEQIIRVISAANRSLHEVESAFSGEPAPVVAPAYAIAVGAESLSLRSNIARDSGNGTIVDGPATKWLSRAEAIVEFDL